MPAGGLPADARDQERIDRRAVEIHRPVQRCGSGLGGVLENDFADALPGFHGLALLDGGGRYGPDAGEQRHAVVDPDVGARPLRLHGRDQSVVRGGDGRVGGDVEGDEIHVGRSRLGRRAVATERRERLARHRWGQRQPGIQGLPPGELDSRRLRGLGRKLYEWIPFPAAGIDGELADIGLLAFRPPDMDDVGPGHQAQRQPHETSPAGPELHDQYALLAEVRRRGRLVIDRGEGNLHQPSRHRVQSDLRLHGAGPDHGRHHQQAAVNHPGRFPCAFRSPCIAAGRRRRGRRPRRHGRSRQRI